MSQLKDLLVEELQDLYHAEMQLTKAIPKMAEAAHNPKLREAFRKAPHANSRSRGTSKEDV